MPLDITEYQIYITEYQICCAIKDFADYNQIVLIHVANEGARSKFTGHRLKRIGLMPGFADYFGPQGNATHKGLFLEVKTIKGKPTIAQKSFIDMVNNEGYYGTIAYGLDACLEVIRGFYGL